MNIFIYLLLIILVSTDTYSQSEVKIGNQIWMTKNLDVDRFRNGDIIPEVKDSKTWIEYAQARKPAWCYYDNNPVNGKKFGKLYNWFAMNDPRGLAPEGWHVPNDLEWETLSLTIQKLCGYEKGKVMYSDVFKQCSFSAIKSINGWREDEMDWRYVVVIAKPQKVYSNSSGFNAQPSGMRRKDGLFLGEPSKYNLTQKHGVISARLAQRPESIGKPIIPQINSYAAWWSSSLRLDYRNDKVARAFGLSYINFPDYCFDLPLYPNDGYSVRCIKD